MFVTCVLWRLGLAGVVVRAKGQEHGNLGKGQHVPVVTIRLICTNFLCSLTDKTCEYRTFCWLRWATVIYFLCALCFYIQAGFPENALSLCELLRNTCVSQSQATSERGNFTPRHFATQVCNLSVSYSQVMQTKVILSTSPVKFIINHARARNDLHVHDFAYITKCGQTFLHCVHVLIWFWLLIQDGYVAIAWICFLPRLFVTRTSIRRQQKVTRLFVYTHWFSIWRISWRYTENTSACWRWPNMSRLRFGSTFVNN